MNSIQEQLTRKPEVFPQILHIKGGLHIVLQRKSNQKKDQGVEEQR